MGVERSGIEKIMTPLGIISPISTECEIFGRPGLQRMDKNLLPHRSNNIRSTIYGNDQPTTFPTGIPTLDTVVYDGQGQPTGSLLGILEDDDLQEYPSHSARSTSSYTNLMAKCYISQALSMKQPVCLINGTDLWLGDPKKSKLLQSLPSSQRSQNPEQRPNTVEGMEKLSIAWRYKHILQTTEASEVAAATSKSPKSLVYDHKRPLNFDTAVKDHVDLYLHQQTSSSPLDGALTFIQNFIQTNVGKTVRIVILGLGGPELRDPADARLIQFLHSVREIVSSNAAAIAGLVTIAGRLLPAQVLAHLSSRCSPLLAVNPFREPLAGGYAGFLRIVRPLRIPGSLRLALPPSLDLAFRMDLGRRFVIETFHLPPDISESQDAAGKSCSSAILQF